MNPLEKFNEEVERLRGFMESIGSEISEFNELVKSTESPVLRRIRCRIVFSCIESYISHLKQSALLLTPEDAGFFSPEERLALADLEAHVTDKGVVLTRKAKIGLKPNLRLAFRAFAKSHGEEYDIDFGDSGGHAFIRAVKIRDRLTHPKSKEDLQVSVEEDKTVTAAWIWFGEHLVACSSS